MRWAAVGLVVSLLAVGCASGRGSTDASGEQATTATTTADATFGSLESPCGPGDPAGATDQGVTGTSIKIGYGDDAGFLSSPGLNHEMSDAVRIMTEWCNEQGGINGRQIDATYYDAAITNVNNVMTEACKSEFFLVGEGWSLDSAQETERRSCGLPAVPGYAVSPQFANAPDAWHPFPSPADYINTAPAAQLAASFPEQIKHTATLYANYAATIDTNEKLLSTWPAFGYEFDCSQQYNITGEADWKPILQKLKNCGSQVVLFIGSPYPNFENILTTAQQIDYEPIWYVAPAFYARSFADWNVSGLADNTYLPTYYTPLEEAAASPATQQYLDLMEQYGGDTSLLGQQATSAFLLWATAAKACGADLTRECVGHQLSQTHDWTGGGLHVASDPGANLPSECGALLKLEGTTFVRVTPTAPNEFACDPSFVTKVTGPVVDRANLDENRISHP